MQISQNKDTPEYKREKIRQEELKRPSSSIHGSNLSDLVGGLGWKGSLLLILALAIGLIITL